MSSVVTFYYQPATYIWICHVKRLQATSQLKHAAHLRGHKKLNKLDDRKIFNFKKGIGIESEKYANKSEIKKVWKQVKDRAQ